MTDTAQSDVGAIRRLVLKHARDAFGSRSQIEAEWRDLRFTEAPDFGRAIEEYDRFAEILRAAGADIEMLPRAPGVTLDSIYVRDASIACDRGIILCRMGKPLREAEPAAQETALRALGYPIVGSIRAPGRLEGGDVVWLDPATLAVGRGYRTNDDGIAQLRDLLGDSIDELVVVPLPHWRGPADVFHLMSVLSPIERDLAVVYSPLLPVPFRERLVARGTTLVEVPAQEFDTMGANVLSIGERRAVMVAGNPITRQRVEAAGVEVVEYDGLEISHKGGGGPTCLTRPVARAWGDHR
jgi:N-dimethylarginine dimethylaminohydrolase